MRRRRSGASGRLRRKLVEGGLGFGVCRIENQSMLERAARIVPAPNLG
jgi:hypothetical protein